MLGSSLGLGLWLRQRNGLGVHRHLQQAAGPAGVQEFPPPPLALEKCGQLPMLGRQPLQGLNSYSLFRGY